MDHESEINNYTIQYNVVDANLTFSKVVRRPTDRAKQVDKHLNPRFQY